MKFKRLIIPALCALVCSPAALAAGLFGGGPFNGFYVGGQGGYGAANSDITDSTGITGLSVDFGSSGATYGVLGGWGMTLQNSKIYLGLEGQYNWLDRAGEISFGTLIPGAAIEWDAQDMWSAGGRLGYLVSENTMFFARGAYASLDAKISVPASFGINVDLDRLDGYQIGLGVEHHIANNFTLRGEFVYSDYSDADLSIDVFGGDVAEVDDTTTEGMVSLSYSF